MNRFSWLRTVCAAGLMFIAAGCATTNGGSAMSEADADVAAQVAQRLAVDPSLRGQFFGVDVSAGEVTVNGTVRSEAERLRVISIVRGTPGVTGVIDRLRLVR